MSAYERGQRVELDNLMTGTIIDVRTWNPSGSADYHVATSAEHSRWVSDNQIIAVLAEPEQGPWVVWHFDPDADDRRGQSRECGTYRVRANAEAYVNKLNAWLLDRYNVDRGVERRRAQAAWDERAVLAAAGLRPAPTVDRPADFVPLPELPELSGRAERYSFAPIECEDD